MEYERLLKILRTISDLNENNIIERVKEELEKEDPDTYKKWQDNGFNINYTFDDQSTLLHIAARNDLVKIAELLIKKGGNVNTADQDGWNTLHFAAASSSIGVVEILIANGVNVNVADQNGFTPLHCAAHNENKEIVELILDKGANVDAVNQNGCTPLHCATINGHEEIVELLLEKRANVDVADEYGRTPLCWAIRNGYSEIARILLENKADPLLGHKSFNTLKLLIELIKNDFKHSKKAEETQQQEDDEYELIKYSLLLRNDCSLTDVVERSAFGKLISTWLVDMSNLTESQKELNKKFLSTFKDFPHVTYKDYKNDVEKIKKFLLDHKSNQDLKTILNLKRGESKLTILHILSSMECSNSEECIDLLLNSGADPNEKDDTGRTPLHYATRSGHCDTIIKLLLRKGANLDIKDKKGKTPIEFAVNNPHLNIKECFLTDDVIYGTFRNKTQADYNGKKYLRKSVNLWGNDFLLDEQDPGKYFCKLDEVQDINQLEQVVNEAIKSRVRFNLTCEGNIYENTYENKYNFTDYVIRRISELKIFQVERDIEVASRIVCNLVKRGAVLETLSSIIVIDKLEKFKDHKANLKEARKSYIHYSLRFLEAAKNATTGKVKEAKMDNFTFCLKYSKNSIVEVAKIINGTDESTEFRRDVIAIGESEIEILTEGGVRNYTDLIGNIVLTFHTDLGKVDARLYSDVQDEEKIIVEVSNKEEILEKFKNYKEELGENCLLGGSSVYDAIKQGYFKRPEEVDSIYHVSSSLENISLFPIVQQNTEKIR
ncbi:ankyrin repeat domain protein [Wolbachia endosymbiont of Culex quinquefasciatus JHB]|uniref:ankyrin repeat domain-containing protein n=1 Tax=unclassified Wolbachia TaxID=2640676 RepID=UPI0001761D40|nr:MULTISPECIES: ankyrin repeat domain-containing protein [unclassified Wolbachia]EEB55337.1 ankyrin repeat domain protein [Wolbachia endosymbiont of Culex quinquefasciatus JHB]CAQ54498.1 ankyrin repeat domain protein [Wolbachia endosymbiont of Culex quinquefasciatus Pel]CQD10391.1 ankyrin repeat domain protein [Wolbachia endosymbiont wPip_Mol of Culex molestus]